MAVILLDAGHTDFRPGPEARRIILPLHGVRICHYMAFCREGGIVARSALVIRGGNLPDGGLGAKGQRPAGRRPHV